MLSYTDWLNEDFTIPTDKRSFDDIKEQLLLFCIDPTSIFNRDTNNLQLYTKIYNTTKLDELTPYLVWIKKGDYVQALTNWFKQFTIEQKNTKFTEDYGVISDTLKRYKQIRSNFRPMPDPESEIGELKDYSIYKDILQFKTLTEFYDVMALFEKEQTKAEKLREIKEDVLVVHYTDNLKILVPLTEDASKIYGKGTKWCTAADNNNMFIDYAEDGPLFIIIKNDNKYQFHIESRSYMNTQDQEIYNYEELFDGELNLIENWRKQNLKTYFDIIEFSKADINITEDNIKYAKYLKYNKHDKLQIRYTYLNQQVIDILDSLTCKIIIYLNSENDYKELNNKRKYFIVYNNENGKFYFKDKLKIEPEILLNLYYTIDGTYEIKEDKFYIKGDLKLKRKYNKMPDISIEEVSGYFSCNINELESLEFGPKMVNGDYYCHNNNLKTLKGCAEIINGAFDCSYNNLTSLEYGPKRVNEYYRCYQNKLKTLKGCAETIGGSFSCSYNELTSLEFGPKYVSQNYYCINNNLKTLKGCAEIIGGEFACSNNKLIALEFGPKQVGTNYDCSDNKLQTLKGCAEIIGGDFDCSLNKLVSLEFGPKQVSGYYKCSFNNIRLQKPENVEINRRFIN